MQHTINFSNDTNSNITQKPNNSFSATIAKIANQNGDLPECYFWVQGWLFCLPNYMVITNHLQSNDNEEEIEQ